MVVRLTSVKTGQLKSDQSREHLLFSEELGPCVKLYREECSEMFPVIRLE